MLFLGNMFYSYRNYEILSRKVERTSFSEISITPEARAFVREARALDTPTIFASFVKIIILTRDQVGKIPAMAFLATVFT